MNKRIREHQWYYSKSWAVAIIVAKLWIIFFAGLLFFAAQDADAHTPTQNCTIVDPETGRYECQLEFTLSIPPPIAQPEPVTPSPEPEPPLPDPLTPVLNSCTVNSIAELRSCVETASLYDLIDIRSDMHCSGGNCCFSLTGQDNLIISGGGNTLTRTVQQKHCPLLTVTNSTDINLINWTLDDELSLAGCEVSQECPNHIRVNNSERVSMRNVHVHNSKAYAVYLNGVKDFAFEYSSIVNSGILGLYVGHADNYSTGVRIENSIFRDIHTNAIALLGARDVSVTNNELVNNHRFAMWPVAPQFGGGRTGGGQLYLARTQRTTVEGNTITYGNCPNCRGGVHGIEVSEPNRHSVFQTVVRDNTISSDHTGQQIYINQGAVIDLSLIHI